MTGTEASCGRERPAEGANVPGSAPSDSAAPDLAGAQDRLRRQRTARASRRAARLQRLDRGTIPVPEAG